MPTIISLYSGCGGMDLGLKKAGFNTVFATDIWNIACDTLKKNAVAEEIVCDDIRNISFEKYKNRVDMVIGGPPCPPYSQTRHYLVNKKNGLDDEKAGYAVPEYMRVVETVKPSVFIFENVDGFMYKTHQDALNFLTERAAELNYYTTYKIINTANYGIPQTRKRFICIGINKNFGKKYEFPIETHIEPKKNLGDKQNWVTCGDVLHDFDNITEEEKEQQPGSKHHHLLADIPPGDNYLYYTSKRGCVKPLFEWKSRYWTFLLKLSPDRPSWTIQASFSNNQGPFHWRNRFLRIEEIKRLQTIDDDYILCGNFKEQWRQVGNAVPAKLAYILGKKILLDYFN